MSRQRVRAPCSLWRCTRTHAHILGSGCVSVECMTNSLMNFPACCCCVGKEPPPAQELFSPPPSCLLARRAGFPSGNHRYDDTSPAEERGGKHTARAASADLAHGSATGGSYSALPRSDKEGPFYGAGCSIRRKPCPAPFPADSAHPGPSPAACSPSSFQGRRIKAEALACARSQALDKRCCLVGAGLRSQCHSLLPSVAIQ